MSQGAEDGGRAATVTLHSAAADPRTPLGRLLQRGDARVPGSYPLVGPFTSPVLAVSGPDRLLGSARLGLADGPAAAEAAAVRLRRQGVELLWGEPVEVADEIAWLASCRERGADSVRVLRAQPDLLPEVVAGSWWSASLRFRIARRRLIGSAAIPRSEVGGLAVRSDRAFWSGVRSAASTSEWQRMTRASYVVLCYHRVAGEGRPGQERMDLSPRQFHRQLALLRALGWRALSPEEAIRFHDGSAPVIGRRRYVLTFDDGFLDATTAARRAGRHQPQMFAVTGAVGGRGDWLDGEPLASWDELAELARRGGIIGSHASRHVRLDSLPDQEIATELDDSLTELRRRLPSQVPLVAYPHGAHDLRVRRAAIDAGYALGYSSAHGRNGAGTDRWCLRRVEPKAADSLAMFIWKVVTGSNRGPAVLRRRGAG